MYVNLEQCVLPWFNTCVCVCAQCKRKFERDCKEADRAQQYFEKMDADINVTKADVEKVRLSDKESYIIQDS